MAKRTWRRRGKKSTWYVILTVPVREHGEVVRRRREHSTGCTRKADAEKIADEIEAKYHEAARANQAADGSDTTFADAVVLYIQNNPNEREAYFLKPLVEEIGALTLDKLTQAEVQRVAHELYGHCKPSTQARQIYVPISAVYNNAVQAGLAPARKFKKPKGWNRSKKVMSPPDEWYAAIWPHLRPTLKALVTLLITNGLRISEALHRTPADIDQSRWPWVLRLGEYDKAGDRVQIELAEHVIEAIQAIPNWQNQKWLFGTSSRSNIRRDLNKAADKAGVPHHGSHALGRHKAARNFMQSGGSLQGLQYAYRWKDPEMPMKHYGHEEPTEIQKYANEVSRDFLSRVNNVQLRAAKSGNEGQPRESCGKSVANRRRTVPKGHANG